MQEIANILLAVLVTLAATSCAGTSRGESNHGATADEHDRLLASVLETCASLNSLAGVECIVDLQARHLTLRSASYQTMKDASAAVRSIIGTYCFLAVLEARDASFTTSSPGAGRTATCSELIGEVLPPSAE